MIKVYCDNGGYIKELKKLERDSKIKLIYHPYENRNKNINHISLPSKSTWNDMNISWNECIFNWDDFKGSEKFDELEKLIGCSNRRDILHLDSAYKSGCSIFVTSDKDDIYSKKDSIFKLLNMVICLPSDINKEIDNLLVQ